ncbi:MAG: flagellar motor switch protein FliM [Deltaproteobacteria bacterium]|nr:flagellar motor switch protein FliM [Deltaproteobacteria bacterium]
MSQILSQNEVDALLKGISGGEVEVEQGVEPEEGIETSVYDLTKPDKAVRLPKLVVITDKFSRTFRITLSNTIRKLAEVSFESTDVKRFDEFLKEIPVPANINIFNMEPLRGFNILLIDSVLVFYFVDVLFGGGGSDRTKVEGREFTSIETTVIKKIARIILDDWSKAWEAFVTLKSEYVRSEVNPQFAMVVPPNDLVITISFNIEIENVSGVITICVPFSNLEPIKEKLMGDSFLEQSERDPFWQKIIRKEIQAVPVDMHIELGKTEIKGRDLINLVVGDIIPLYTFSSDDLDVYVSGKKKFTGQPGTYHGNNAIQITNLVDRR